MIIWLSQDSNATPSICLAASAIFANGALLIWPDGRPSRIAAVLALVAVMYLAAKLAPKRTYPTPVEAE